jgi:hypothetical protein
VVSATVKNQGLSKVGLAAAVWVWAVEYKVGCKPLSIPEVVMMILVPFKPVLLVLGLLTGLIFVGFVGSSLLEGKEPFVMDRGQARHALVKQDHPQRVPSVRVQ